MSDKITCDGDTLWWRHWRIGQRPANMSSATWDRVVYLVCDEFHDEKEQQEAVLAELGEQIEALEQQVVELSEKLARQDDQTVQIERMKSKLAKLK